MEIGTYCQNITPPTYESTGQNLTVIFKADGDFNNYYGFNATYTCIGSLTTSPPAGLGFVKKEQSSPKIVEFDHFIYSGVQVLVLKEQCIT